MKRFLLASTLLTVPVLAFGQSLQTGNIDGMPYYLLPASGGCSAATPCSVITYLGVQSESAGAIANDVQNYFGGTVGPHTIVIAPQENGQQDAATNWGGYDALNTPEQQQMIAVVQGVEAQMGNTVNPAASVVTGGSLGGTGTQDALAAAGPKGLTTPGVFSAGVSFDAALWVASDPAVVAALCGVPLTAVHGTNDTNQSISFDQNLASEINGNPACGNSFTLVPIQGAGHGTWSDPSVGYQAGTGPGTPLATIAADLNSAPAAGTATPQTIAAAPSNTASPPAAVAPQPAPTVESATITPGGGSITDAKGNVWTITANGKIEENGQPVPGGGDTSQLTVENGTVWGQDDDSDPSRANAGGWFTLSGDGAGGSWVPSPSSPAAQPAAAAAQPVAAQTLAPVVDACTTAVPNAAPSTGGFGTIDGQFYDPSGQPWIAQGVNVASFNMDQAQSTLLSLLPNTNFIRLNIYSYADPSTYQSFINYFTAHGVVVEIDDHTSFPSNAFSGSQLSTETAFFSAMAAANKTNPYVWFETQNEPQGGDITDEEVAVYNAVRSAGNNNPVGMQLYGGGDPGFLGLMNLSAYTSMTNVFIAPHFYDWLAQYSSDPGTVSAALNDEISNAKQIQTADGTPPILIDEYGDSTDGSSIDAGGSATVAAVNQSGYGSAAWNFMNPGGNGDPADQVTNGGQSLSPMGQQLAAFQTTPGAGCAQSTTPTPAIAETAPALTASNSATTAPVMPAAATSVTAPALPANSLSVQDVAKLAAGG